MWKRPESSASRSQSRSGAIARQLGAQVLRERHPSSSSSRRLYSTPSEPYEPIPPAATTRWHGTNEREPVLAQKRPRGARRARAPGERRELAVRDDLAVRDRPERLVDRALERRPVGELELHVVEVVPGAGEERAGAGPRAGRVRQPLRRSRRRRAAGRGSSCARRRARPRAQLARPPPPAPRTRRSRTLTQPRIAHMAAAPGIFRPPPPGTSPSRTTRPARPSARSCSARLAELQRERLDIPPVIGGEDVRTGDTFEAVMPHRKEPRPRGRPQGRRRRGRAGDRGRRRRLARLVAHAVGGPRRGLPPRGRAARRPVAPDAERGDDAQPVEDGAPGRDRRRLRAHRLLALQRRVHAAHLRGAADLVAGHLEPHGVPAARGLRLRGHARSTSPRSRATCRRAPR